MMDRSTPSGVKTFSTFLLKDPGEEAANSDPSIALHVDGAIESKGSYPPGNKLAERLPGEPILLVGEGKKPEAGDDINGSPLEKRKPGSLKVTVDLSRQGFLIQNLFEVNLKLLEREKTFRIVGR